MEESLFTKIIKGEIPSYKIYEDDKTFAFLNIHPKQDGHILIVPKTQIEFVWDLSDEDYVAVMATARKMANRLKEVLKPKYVAMEVQGMHVPHAHVHVFPFNTAEELHSIPDENAPPDNPRLEAIADKLRLAVQ